MVTLQNIKDTDPKVDAMLEAEINKGARRVVLDEARVLCTVVGVVPLVRRQQQLAQRVRQAQFAQGFVVARVQRQNRHDLQHQHQQLLLVERNTACNQYS